MTVKNILKLETSTIIDKFAIKGFAVLKVLDPFSSNSIFQGY